MTTTAQAKQRLASDFHEVLNDIDALLAAATNQAEGEASALRSRIADRLEAATARIADAQHEAVERAKRAAGAADDYVHDHPWQAIGIGAAIGLLAGMLLGRR